MAIATGERSVSQRQIDIIRDAIEQGSTYRAAYETAGIPESTFFDLLKSSSEFSEIVAHARSAAELLYTKPLHIAVTSEDADLKVRVDASKFWLERRRRSEYGPTLDLGKIPTERLTELLTGTASDDDYLSVQSLRKQRLTATVDSQEPIEVSTSTNPNTADREPG